MKRVIEVPCDIGDVIYLGFEAQKKNASAERPIPAVVELISVTVCRNGTTSFDIKCRREETGGLSRVKYETMGLKWWLTKEEAEKALGIARKIDEARAIREEISKLRKRLKEICDSEEGVV